MPRASPSFRLPFASQAQPNASTGPDLVARPKLISAMTPVKPMRATKKYIRNQERASSVKGHSGWKHPDISHANGGADAGEDKAPTTAKRFAIVLISTHLISPLNNNMI